MWHLPLLFTALSAPQAVHTEGADYARAVPPPPTLGGEPPRTGRHVARNPSTADIVHIEKSIEKRARRNAKRLAARDAGGFGAKS